LGWRIGVEIKAKAVSAVSCAIAGSRRRGGVAAENGFHCVSKFPSVTEYPSLKCLSHTDVMSEDVLNGEKRNVCVERRDRRHPPLDPPEMRDVIHLAGFKNRGHVRQLPPPMVQLIFETYQQLGECLHQRDGSSICRKKITATCLTC